NREAFFVNRWLQKWVARFGLESRPRLRRFLIGTIGFSVVLIGLVMIVLPGPAIIIVPLGFAILASEFAWARRVWRSGTILVSRITGRRVPREPVETRCHPADLFGAAAENSLFSVRPAEFYSAYVMVPREQRVGN